MEGLYDKFISCPSYSAMARHCRELKSLVAHTKNKVDINHVSLSTPAPKDRYSEGYEDGRSVGYKDGYDEGCGAAEEKFRRSQASHVTSSVQTSPPPATAASATQTEPCCPRVIREHGVQASEPFDWASEPIDSALIFHTAVPPLPLGATTPRAHSTSSADPNFPRDPRSQPNGFAASPPGSPLSTQHPVPSHVERLSLVDAPIPPLHPTLRDLSSLRSGNAVQPFSTLQRRTRRVRARRSRPSHHSSRQYSAHFPDPSITGMPPAFAWDTDPRLAVLSAVLRSLGWTCVSAHGEDAAHVW